MIKKVKYNQVKIGATLSYMLIVLNALYALIITPYIIKMIGQDEYGVYKIIASLSSALIVLDFGLGSTVQRYVANYRSRQQDDRISDFISHSIFIACILNIVIIVVSAFVFFMIEPVYGSNLKTSQIIMAQRLYIVIVVNLLFVVIENVLNGIITGYNNFAFGNGLKLMSMLLRMFLVWIILSIYKSAIVIVSINLSISILLVIIQFIYVRKQLKIKIKFIRWNREFIIDAGKYTWLMFLTSISSQIFSNVDNVIIGSICTPVLVAVYSIGLQFFEMFQQLSSGIAGVMLPTVSRAVVKDEIEGDNRNTIKIVIKVGRLQFIILGAALTGFICIGKDFIEQWLGKGYEDAYIVTMILLIPSMFELCINVCLSILRAKNKLVFRTFVVAFSAVLNVLLTVIFVKIFSYIGAAVATAVSYIICSLLAMNVYYSKVIHLPMKKIYKAIFKKVWICLIISGIILRYLSCIIKGSWFALIVNIVIFFIVYASSLYIIAFDNNERKKIPLINRLIK